MEARGHGMLPVSQTPARPYDKKLLLLICREF
jgi:hypothetical protein